MACARDMVEDHESAERALAGIRIEERTIDNPSVSATASDCWSRSFR